MFDYEPMGKALFEDLVSHLRQSQWAGLFAIEIGRDGIVLCRQCVIRDYESAVNAFIEDAMPIIAQNGYKKPRVSGADRNENHDFVLRFARG